MSQYLGGPPPSLPHLAWCPAAASPEFGCYCRLATLELTDPRAAVVEAATERYRAANPAPPAPEPTAWQRLTRALGGGS